MRLAWGLAVGVLVYAVGAGGAARSASKTTAGALATEGMTPLAGQQRTCAGPRHKTFTLEISERTIDLGMNLRYAGWTFGGTIPAPTIEACEDDEVSLVVANHGTALHGLDSHALRTSVGHFGPVGPDKTLDIHSVVDTPGVYMYHCAAGMMTDTHIKRGMAGAMIVYPRAQTLAPARELVVVQSAVYGDPDDSGLIDGAAAGRAMLKNDPSFIMYNGRLSHETLHVAVGDRIRAYFVNVGPGTASVHVMGTILDRVVDGSREIDGVQSYGVPAGSGAIVEFTIPDAGAFGLVDHDRLGFLPMGLMLGFSTESGHASHDM